MKDGAAKQMQWAREVDRLSAIMPTETASRQAAWERSLQIERLLNTGLSEWEVRDLTGYTLTRIRRAVWQLDWVRVHRRGGKSCPVEWWLAEPEELKIGKRQLKHFRAWINWLTEK